MANPWSLKSLEPSDEEKFLMSMGLNPSQMSESSPGEVADIDREPAGARIAAPGSTGNYSPQGLSAASVGAAPGPSAFRKPGDEVSQGNTEPNISDQVQQAKQLFNQMPSVSPMTGKHLDVKQAGKSENKSLQTQSTWAQDPTGIADTLRQLPEITAQQQGMEAAKQLLGMQMAMPARADLSPLLALTDTWTGSNLQKGYNAPPSPEERQAMAVQGALKLQGDQTQMAKTMLDAVRSFKSGQLLNQGINTSNWDTNIGAGSQRGYNPMQTIRGAESEFEKGLTKIMDPAEEHYASLKTLADALSSNNLQHTQQVLTIVAKQLGKDSGKIANQEIVRTLPSTIATDTASLEAYLTNTPTAKIPASVGQGLRQFAAWAIQHETQKYKNQMSDWLKSNQAKSSGAGANFSGQAQPYFDRLNNDFGPFVGELQRRVKTGQDPQAKPAPGAAPAGPPQKAAKDMTDDELKAYLKAHGQ